MTEPPDLTRLLERARDDEAERARLMDAVYDQLKQIAAAQMRGERDGHTLQPTALAHEGIMRLAGARLPWQSRAHFFGAAATAMRRVLVDHARARNSAKRQPDGATTPRDHAGTSTLEIDDLLRRFEQVDPRRAHVVELKVFGGLTNDQIANLLGVARSTIANDWSVARAWLAAQMREGATG